jgi:hypothetical protein
VASDYNLKVNRLETSSRLTGGNTSEVNTSTLIAHGLITEHFSAFDTTDIFKQGLT